MALMATMSSLDYTMGLSTFAGRTCPKFCVYLFYLSESKSTHIFILCTRRYRNNSSVCGARMHKEEYTWNVIQSWKGALATCDNTDEPKDTVLPHQRKQPSCPSADERIRKLCTHTPQRISLSYKEHVWVLSNEVDETGEPITQSEVSQRNTI